MPRVGQDVARYGDLPHTARELHTLTPPHSDAARWRALLGIADRMGTNAQHQIAAARFVRTTSTSHRLISLINHAGEQFGCNGSSPCGQVHG
jgi:hypothetical protein